MAITPFEKDIEIIQKLDDEPNDVQGLSPAELKRRFDQAAIWFKEYINDTLLPGMTGSGAGQGAENIGAGVDDFAGNTVQAILDAFNDALVERYTKTEAGTLVREETSKLVKSVSVNLTTGVITVVQKDGTTTTFDTALEKVPASFALEDKEDGTYLVVTNQDGSRTETSVSKLIDTYTFSNSADISFSVTGSGNNRSVTASIRDGSIGLAKLSLEVTQALEDYKAAGKASADAAAASRTAAKTSETNANASKNAAAESASAAAQKADEAGKNAASASASAASASAEAASAQRNAAAASGSAAAAGGKATLSQSWAVGGTGTRDGEDTDNAKYWSQQAQAAAGGGVIRTELRPDQWNGDSAPYTCTIPVPLDENSIQLVLPSESITPAQMDALRLANIQYGGQTAGSSFFLKAYGEKPVRSIPVKIVSMPEGAEREYQEQDDPSAPDIAGPVTDMSKAVIAMATTAGIAPSGNPDHVPGSNPGDYYIYDIAGANTMSSDRWETASGGFDPSYANANPNVFVPLDAMRAKEVDGSIGKVYERFYSTVGNGASAENAQKWGKDMGYGLKAAAAEGVVLTAADVTSIRAAAQMAKKIEKAGVPTVLICTVTQIAVTLGVSRIVPGVAVPFAMGNPTLSAEEDLALRTQILGKALQALQTAVTEPTVFE